MKLKGVLLLGVVAGVLTGKLRDLAVKAGLPVPAPVVDLLNKAAILG